MSSMTAFVEFLQPLLHDGTARLRERPAPSPEARTAAIPVLAAAYDDHRLDVAGPLLPFDAPAALAAAERVWWACWFLVQRSEPPTEVERHLRPGPAPTSAAEHLSIDLTARFLPLVHRRARAIKADDPLTRLLENLLRHWPLTGVLTDIGPGPSAPLDFGGHHGLLLLYAERLADHVRPDWAPVGAGREQVELVFEERKLRVPAPLQTLPAGPN